MRYEIIELNGLQVIGIAREIAFKDGPTECPKFWAEEYVEKIVKPVIMEGNEPNELQKAAFENNVGEFGLCTCKYPGHNCITCGADNFGACSTKTFTYVIGGTYKGGNVPEGMKLFSVPNGRWLKMHFEGGMPKFQEQYAMFYEIWIKEHPEFKFATDGCVVEWYDGNDIESPDYKCGIMMPIE